VIDLGGFGPLFESLLHGATQKGYNMSTYDEFKKKYPKLIEEAEEDLKTEEEDFPDDFTCPVCGSCGEEGCCGIDCCKEVQGLYCDHNKQTYRVMERQWGIMWEALQKIQSIDGGRSGHIADKAIEDVRDDMKLEVYYDHESREEE